MLTVTIANQKGGVGKTTTAIELASILVSRGYRVLAIDMDQQCNLTTYAGCRNRTPTIFDVLNGDVFIGDAIVKNVDGGGYDLVPGSKSLSKADRTFTSMNDPFLLKAALSQVSKAKSYDFVLTDNGPSRNVLLNMAYVASNYVIAPMDCDDGSLDGVREMMSDLKELWGDEESLTPRYSDAKICGLILNRFERTKMHGIVKEEVEEMAAQIGELQGTRPPVVCTVPKGIIATMSKRLQVPMQEASVTAKVSESFRDAADMLIDGMADMEEDRLRKLKEGK